MNGNPPLALKICIKNKELSFTFNEFNEQLLMQNYGSVALIQCNIFYRRDKTITEMTNQTEQDQRLISQLQKKIQELLVSITECFFFNRTRTSQ